MPARAVLHVGFQKTASTWLQNVFQATPTVFNVDRLTLIKRLIDPGRFDFNANQAREALLVGHHGETVMVSHEWLVGHPFANGLRHPSDD